MMSHRKALVLVTSSYPFGKGETFLENEILFLAEAFERIVIFPQVKSEGLRSLPENVEVNTALCGTINLQAKKHAFLNLEILLRISLLEIFHIKQRTFFISNIRLFLDTISKNTIKAEILNSQIKLLQLQSAVFYSFWMNDGAQILTILKLRNKISDFIFRVHGFDLFEERREGNYMPFRYTNMKFCKNVYTVSENAYRYLRAKHIFPEKVKLSQLGTRDFGLNPFTEIDKLVIVSCSNIINIKRVHLISEILKYVKTPVKWVHFGSGNALDLVEKSIAELPQNIDVDLRGRVSNSEIIQFYQHNSVSLFIHLSETEGGVPVALQEAASFGIPLLGTDAGGIPEIVNTQTGKLISVDFDEKEIADFIEKFQESQFNKQSFRYGARKFWEKNFSAEKKYAEFCEKIKV